MGARGEKRAEDVGNRGVGISYIQILKDVSEAVYSIDVMQ